MRLRFNLNNTSVPAALLALAAWQSPALAEDVFYSGRALGFHASVNINGATKKLTLAKNDMSCQGLPDEETVSGIENAPPLGVRAKTITTFTQGKDGIATVNAATEQLAVSVPGLELTASVADAFAEVRCVNGQPTASGSSTIGAVTINGETHDIGAEPNQTVEVPGVARIVFNEQAIFSRAARVRAIYITLFDDETPVKGEIRVSEATARISSCAAVCTP